MDNSLVKRQDAIDAIFSEPLYESGMKKRDADAVVPAIYEKIKSLPSVEPGQHWISSGEKLPEKGSYLVWMPFALPEHRITVAEYCGGYWNIKTPISAWMPLPEPYKEGDSDERS